MLVLDVEEININTPAATKSSTIKTPIAILAYKESKSCLSDKIFIIKIVLEKERAIPMYNELIRLKSRSLYATKNETPKVNIISAKAITKEGIPISLKFLGLRCNPTIKRRKAIPNFERVLITSVSKPNLIIKGLIKIPAMIYPIRIGCLNKLTIYEIIKANKSITAN